MRKQLVAAAAAAGIALSLAACATDDPDSPAPQEPGIAEEAVTFNDADIRFAQGMIPHHEQAIEMSDIILSKDDIDPRVVDLAENIKEAQEPEIELLQSWLQEWDAPPATMDHDMHGPDGEHGMMSEADLQALEEAQGAEAQQLFLEQMIIHHEGALAMADAQLRQGSNPAALDLAQTIIDTQQAEIESMRMLISEL